MSEKRQPPDEDVPDDDVPEEAVPDDDVPDELVDHIESESPTVLRAIAEYATALAEARTDGESPQESDEPDAPGGTSRRPSDAVADVDIDSAGGAGTVGDERAEIGHDTPATTTDGDAAVPADADRPDGVPGKASITVKEINENRYYYWQWRDGDAVKSKYHGPVDPSS